MILATEGSTQEMAVIGVSATSRIEGPQDKKIEWSDFPKDNNSSWSTAQEVGAQGQIFC
jgi:hypothetical protein